MSTPPWDPYDPDAAVELARYVRTNDKAAEALAREERLGRLLGGVRRDGREEFHGLGDPTHAAEPQDVDREVETLLLYLHSVNSARIKYQYQDHRSLPRAVNILSPTLILGHPHRGSCVDLTCLTAAMLVINHHYPLCVVLERGTPGSVFEAYHVLLGFWRDRAARVRTAGADDWDGVFEHEELMSACDTGAIGLVEPEWVAHHPKPPKPPDFWIPDAGEYFRRLKAADKLNHRFRYAVDVRRVVLERQPALTIYGYTPPERPKDHVDVAEWLDRQRKYRLASVLRAGSPVGTALDDLLCQILCVAVEVKWGNTLFVGQQDVNWNAISVEAEKMSWPASLRRRILDYFERGSCTTADVERRRVVAVSLMCDLVFLAKGGVVN